MCNPQGSLSGKSPWNSNNLAGPLSDGNAFRNALSLWKINFQNLRTHLCQSTFRLKHLEIIMTVAGTRRDIPSYRYSMMLIRISVHHEGTWGRYLMPCNITNYLWSDRGNRMTWTYIRFGGRSAAFSKEWHKIKQIQPCKWSTLYNWQYVLNKKLNCQYERN